MKSVILGIGGGSGSCKTTLAKKILSFFPAEVGAILAQDSYYIDQSHRFDKDGGAVNFDHPDALDFDLLSLHLQELIKGRDIQVPCYDFATHKRLTKTEHFKALPLVILDGTLIFSQEKIRPHLNLSLFLEMNEQTRLERRIKRDIVERGRTREGVIEQFRLQVGPMHDLYVSPSQKYAQHILNDCSDFDDFLKVFIPHLSSKLSLP